MFFPKHPVVVFNWKVYPDQSQFIASPHLFSIPVSIFSIIMKFFRPFILKVQKKYFRFQINVWNTPQMCARCSSSVCIWNQERIFLIWSFLYLSIKIYKFVQKTPTRLLIMSSLILFLIILSILKFDSPKSFIITINYLQHITIFNKLSESSMCKSSSMMNSKICQVQFQKRTYFFVFYFTCSFFI